MFFPADHRALVAGLAAAMALLSGCAKPKPPAKPPANEWLGSINDQLKARFETEDRLGGHLGDATKHLGNAQQELRK